MKYKFTIIAVLVILMAHPSMVFSALPDSQVRIATIKKILNKHILDSGVDIKQIFREISEHMPLDPVETPEYMNWNKKKEETVKKRFSLTDRQLREILSKKAEKHHPLHKIGDTVTINYLLARKLYNITGTYYRKTDRFIYIGSSKILRRNIPEEFACQFDEFKATFLREKYIKNGIQSYHKKKKDFEDQIFKNEIMQSQGYVKVSNKWISVRDYIQIELKRVVENHVKEQIKMGDRYLTQKKPAEAAKCYRKAAEQGDKDIQYKLGRCYYMQKDYKQAVYWFRKAAKLGNKNGQFYLGMCYANGWGVDTDYIEACNWFKKSADQGHAEAHRLFSQYQNKLEEKDSSDQLFDGRSNGMPEKIINNGPKQKITSEMNFEELCKVLRHFSNKCYCKYVKRDLPAFFNKNGTTIWHQEIKKKIIYNTNLPTYKEKKSKLLRVYKPVIDYINKFYSMPIKQLEKKHLSDEIYYIGDSGYGRSGFCCDWHGTALAQRGSAKAQFVMGFRLLGGRSRYEFAGHLDREAFEEDILWLKLAGENGMSDAYWVLGKKSFLLKEYKTALIWYRKGAEAKNTRCMFELGEFCFKQMDDGIEALRWYIPAADLGHYSALKACAELYSRNTKTTNADYRQAIKYYQMLIEREKRDKSQNYQGRIQYYKKEIEELKLKIE